MQRVLTECGQAGCGQLELSWRQGSKPRGRKRLAFLEELLASFPFSGCRKIKSDLGRGHTPLHPVPSPTLEMWSLCVIHFEGLWLLELGPGKPGEDFDLVLLPPGLCFRLLLG